MQDFKPTWLYIKKHNITGLKYFGKTVKNDPTKYTGSGKYWKAHLTKHGNDITTIWCELFTDRNLLIEQALLISKENNIIDSADWANLKFENGIDGGNVGMQMSDETKKKLSVANTGKKQTPETRNKRSTSNKGKHHFPKSEETKNKISNSLAGRKRGPMPEETKNKIGDANRGHITGPQSEETKRKKSISMMGKNKGKISPKKGIQRSESERKNISDSIKESLKITCPHCNKTGLAGCMTRWHFDNCKNK